MKNRGIVEPTHQRPSTVSLVVKRLLEKGLVVEEKKPNTAGTMRDFWLTRPSLKGIQFIREQDPAEMIRVFFKIAEVPCAILWIYTWMKSLGELPEFISHMDPDIRNAAKVRFEELARDNGYELNRP